MADESANTPVPDLYLPEPAAPVTHHDRGSPIPRRKSAPTVCS